MSKGEVLIGELFFRGGVLIVVKHRALALVSAVRAYGTG